MTEKNTLTELNKDEFMLSKFDIYPSVDIVSGSAMVSQTAINLTMGRYVSESDKQRNKLGSPAEIASKWRKEGAKWVHFVDLDAAADAGNNLAALEKAIELTGLQVQVCGGIRDDESLSRIMDLGCARVNIGTAALENPRWCEKIIAKYAQKIAIALDVKMVDGKYYLTKRGWNVCSTELWGVLKRLVDMGCHRFVVTDVERAGMLTAPNFNLLSEVCSRVHCPVIAGGGVSSIEDIKALSMMQNIGLEGVILGQVIHTEQLNLQDILIALTEH